MAFSSSFFASAQDIPLGASSGTNDNNAQQQPPSKVRHQQKFRKLPDRIVELVEGEDILLGCEVDNQTGSAQWIKDRIPIFRRNGLRVPDSGFPERHVIVGKLPGDHSLELRRVDIADSGLYECQVLPAVDDGFEKPLRAISNVTVRAQPPPTPPTDASTAASTLRYSSSSHLNQQQAQINAQSFSLDEFASPSVGGGTASSQLQPRDIPRQMTKLPGGALQVAATTSQLAPSAFITPYASTASGGGSQHLSALSLVFGWWPALFLIAGCLFLANVYLIYSLVRRHKLSTSGSSGADGSASGSEASSSGAGGGGGGGSSGSSTSTESCAKSISTSISISPNQGYHPHAHAHQHIQQHLQQESQHIQQQEQQHPLHPQHLTLPPPPPAGHHHMNLPPAGGHHHMNLPPAGPHYEFMLLV